MGILADKIRERSERIGSRQRLKNAIDNLNGLRQEWNDIQPTGAATEAGLAESGVPSASTPINGTSPNQLKPESSAAPVSPKAAPSAIPLTNTPVAKPWSDLKEEKRMYSLLPVFKAASQNTGVPLELLLAMATQESHFTTTAVSPVGASGVLQLMPDTARWLGLRVDGRIDERRDPVKNINAGAKYVAYLLSYYGGDATLAVAAYNAGQGRVDRAGRKVPNIRETQNYVSKVQGYLSSYNQLGMRSRMWIEIRTT